MCLKFVNRVLYTRKHVKHGSPTIALFQIPPLGRYWDWTFPFSLASPSLSNNGNASLCGVTILAGRATFNMARTENFWTHIGYGSRGNSAGILLFETKYSWHRLSILDTYVWKFSTINIQVKQVRLFTYFNFFQASPSPLRCRLIASRDVRSQNFSGGGPPDPPLGFRLPPTQSKIPGGNPGC